ncbi:hypothetical protein EJ05DRAFT_483558 [Pseudovirgaria hyperparasitica]|uniref:Uncharacterized protein n=1 Tax=Pseudovirgaria hyperparasitica TaxID=470096 RepID=A0A6A6WEB2_9PEZI|nr:uncharacterized protein EJ05DRAFT_483558 [Pseudovirgaria hyperparasitica]KAF2761162.1 hypothetical protein EJ05DRAFT_483558 [Pseudovirgaria hyperparasitica]
MYCARSRYGFLSLTSLAALSHLSHLSRLSHFSPLSLLASLTSRLSHFSPLSLLASLTSRLSRLPTSFSSHKKIRGDWDFDLSGFVKLLPYGTLTSRAVLSDQICVIKRARRQFTSDQAKLEKDEAALRAKQQTHTLRLREAQISTQESQSSLNEQFVELGDAGPSMMNNVRVPVQMQPVLSDVGLGQLRELFGELDGLSSAVIQVLWTTFQPWNSGKTKKDWMKHTREQTPMKCISRKMAKKGVAVFPHGEDFACDYCMEKQIVCCALNNGLATARPLAESEQTKPIEDDDLPYTKDDVAYWVKQDALLLHE